ncbi:DUF3883 domain-containing protein [Cobetia sp. UCD-24C]|uniref:DUF3883 domain-containing protein n=1 Tax=Cobetia sp. UCD-24C TaxID=1716176 RepID=UPI0009EBEBB8|nr:DUF3883 domain-containing protein [Cobetia sp. UCD-24C]
MNRVWDDYEIEATVSTYRNMLLDEVRNTPYTKKTLNTYLAELLNNRTGSAIDKKHQNISAVLCKHGLPYIKGYQPLFNHQLKIENYVNRIIVQDEEINIALLEATRASIPHAPHLRGLNVEVAPPDTKEHNLRGSTPQYSITSNKVDYLAREQLNSDLGLAGEQFIVKYEKLKLESAGLKNLADKVEHVSVTKGDGLGYDITSFDLSGREIFIEVKTTLFNKNCHFYISPHELKTSELHSKKYHLYGVFDFLINPRFFCISGNLFQRLTLNPQSYRAHLL